MPEISEAIARDFDLDWHREAEAHDRGWACMADVDFQEDREDV